MQEVSAGRKKSQRHKASYWWTVVKEWIDATIDERSLFSDVRTGYCM